MDYLLWITFFPNFSKFNSYLFDRNYMFLFKKEYTDFILMSMEYFLIFFYGISGIFLWIFYDISLLASLLLFSSSSTSNALNSMITSILLHPSAP